MEPSSPPGFSGNLVLKKKICHFLDEPPTHDGLNAPSRCVTALHCHANSESRHPRLSNCPYRLEKLHGGAKFPPPYFWQPGSEKKNFVTFLTNLQPIPVRPLLAGVTQPSKVIHFQKGDTLGFLTVQTDWKNSTMAPGYATNTSGNLVLKKKHFVIFLTNLQPMIVQPLQAAVEQSSTVMHIQKVDTLGFLTVQTDRKNPTVAPSNPPNTFAPWFVKNTVGSNKRAPPPCPTPRNLITRHCRCEHVSCNVVCKPSCQFVV